MGRRRQLSPHFACYGHIQFATHIPDEDDVVVVLPEICSHLVHSFKRARIIHAHQSEYARLHLEANGVTSSFPLSDYINDHYQLEEVSDQDKLNLVAFNPRKGYEITRLIIANLSPYYGFAPLTGLDRAQVKDWLRHSKLSIDFGHHPGKDRLPREAALMGNCILVGTLGAARSALDVPIPSAYKMEVQRSQMAAGKPPQFTFNLLTTCEMIDAVMHNYGQHVQAFTSYVRSIQQEKVLFDRQVAQLFNTIATTLSGA